MLFVIVHEFVDHLGTWSKVFFSINDFNDFYWHRIFTCFDAVCMPKFVSTVVSNEG